MTKSLLLVMPDGTEREHLIGKLDGAYSLLCVDSPEDYPAILREKSFSLSAVLVDLRLTGNTGYCFSEALPDNGPFSRLPLIGVAPDVTDELAGWVLERGFSEIIEPTLPQALLLRRIQNVIRATDSMSFPELERLLRALPANIFLKDAQGRYVFSTQHWHHLYHAEDPNWSIRGLTDLEIKLLPDGARTITLELGVRFLTDWLDGDKYFAIKYPEHNLDRCRSQLALALDMEIKREEMKEIVNELSGN